MTLARLGALRLALLALVAAMMLIVLAGAVRLASPNAGAVVNGGAWACEPDQWYAYEHSGRLPTTGCRFPSDVP